MTERGKLHRALRDETWTSVSSYCNCRIWFVTPACGNKLLETLVRVPLVVPVNDLLYYICSHYLAGTGGYPGDET